jgi:hypothetical protein
MSDLPPFIVVRHIDPKNPREGDWQDEEWNTLSRSLTSALTAGELARVIAGPRRHPYGPGAYQAIVDGEVVIYPSKEAAGV